MRSIRTWLAASAAAMLIFAGTAAAQNATHAVYIDTDNNAATGCTVVTAAGPADGAEVRLTATTNGTTVTTVVRETCAGGVFGSPQAQAAGYPIGINNGTNGADVVEMATPLLGLGSGPVRLIFVSNTANGADLVVANGVSLQGGTGTGFSTPAIIPSTGVIALIVLVLLVGVAAWLLRRHPGLRSSLALLLLLSAGIAWAANFITDGQIGDWTGESPDALDAANDSTSGESTIDLVAVFAATEAGSLFFRLDVRDAQNNAPVAIAPAPVTLNEDSSVTITLTGSDAESSPLTFAIGTLPTRGTLGPIVPVNATTATVLYTANANQNGADSFTFTVNDGSTSSAPATVSITITPVNDAPVVAPQTLAVVENSPNGTVVGTATATDVDTGQTLTWAITGGNALGAFAINPATGQITVADTTDITPANSPFSLTVQATDNGVPPLNGSATITINVTGVNDEPSFTAGPNQAVNEDAPAQSVPWATAISAGPPDEAGQTLTFTVTNDNNALFAVQPAIDPAGTLTYTLVANANGVANVAVFLMDNGGTAGGGDDTSPTQNFTITVTAVNDAPAFTAGPTQNVLQDAGPQTVPAWATGINVGPANEAGQTLTFNITNNTNAALFSAGPSIAADGTLTYTPAAGLVGTADITITLSDNGGTANGGFDTSAPQTFTINVNNLNDAPVFTIANPPPASLEDGGAQTVNAFATGIDDGDPPVVQTLTFNVINNTNPGLFLAGPAIDATTGNLTYTANPNANGTADITVVLQDNGGTANGGVDTSAPQTFTITVTAVNDVPSFLVGPNQSVPQDSPAQTVPNFATAISAGPADETGQTLTFNVSVTTNPGLFTVAPAIAADGTLTYTPAAGQTGTADISVTLSDNGGVLNGGVDTSAAQTFTITLEDVNEVPVPSATPASPITLPENSPPATVVTDIAPNDPDVGQTHTYVFQSGNTGNVFAIDANGVITVVGPLDFEGPDDPYTLVVRVTDNGVPALFADISITVNLSDVNEAPVVTAGGTLAYTEGAGAVVLNGAVTVTDPDAGEGLASATVQITGNLAAAEDVLAFTNTVNITGVYTAASGTLALTGNDTPAAYQAALASVTYQNTSNAPSTLQRTVSWSVNDGALASNVATSTIDITTVNSAPVVTTTGGSTAYVENGPAVVIDAGVTATDSDSPNAVSALVQITGGLQSGEDLLAFVNTASITGVYFPVTGELQLSGTDSFANYQAALASITYANSSDAPNTGARTISFSITDNGAPGLVSNIATKTVTVAAANDAPVVTLSGSTPSFTEGGAAVAVDSGVTVTDADDINLETATVTITNAFAGDLLTGTSGGGVTVTGSGTTTLSLSGSASLAAYIAVLQGVTFDSPGDNPDPTARIVRFVVNDGDTNSNLADKTVTVVAVNDAPVNTVPGAQVMDEDTALTFTGGSVISVADADLAAGSMTVTLTATNGTINADDTGGAGIANDNTAVVTLTGTLAQINATLDGTIFNPTPNFFGSASVTVLSNDNGNTGTGGAQTDSDPIAITVNPVNDAPTVATPPSANVHTNIAIDQPDDATNDLLGSARGIADIDSTGPFVIAPASIGTFATVAGGSITITADGHYHYNPQVHDTGADSFVYQICDNEAVPACTNVTLSLTIAGLDIVFVNDDAAAGGDGTLERPLQTFSGGLAALGGSVNLFLFSGNYTGGVTLANNVRVFGQGSTAASFDALYAIAPPVLSITRPALSQASPVITSGGVGITLGQNNSLRGLTLGANTSDALFGNNFGTLTVSDNVVINNTTDRALNLTTGNAAATFVSVTSTNSGTTGISLTGVTGSLTLGSTTISGSTTQGILVGTTTANVDFGNTSVTGGTDGVSLQNNSAGTRTFGTLTIATGSGIGFNHAVGGGTTTAGATTVTNPGGTGIDINASTTAVTFGNTTVDKGTTAGVGVNLVNSTGTITFNSLGVTTSNGTALTADTDTSVVVTNASGALAATNGAAINSTGTGWNGNFASATSTNSPTQGINLNAVTGTLALGGGSISGPTGVAFFGQNALGTVTYGGSISKTSDGNLVQISGAAAGTVTLSGNLTCNTACDGIDVLNRTGGTITFSGASKVLNTTASAASPAVNLDNNDAAQIHFTGGGLDIDTTSGAGFNAINGATQVTVQGGTNTIVSTTGIGLNVVSSTIGGLGLTFQSINVNGATNGIVLDGTGAGFLNVTGTGGVCTVATPTCTGGTIQSTIDDGVALTNANNVTLTRMRLLNAGNTTPPDLTTAQNVAGDHAVQISGGSNVVLASVVIQTPGGGGILARNLNGTNRINGGSEITGVGGIAHVLYALNISVNNTLFEIDGSRIFNCSSSSSTVVFFNEGTANMTFTVNNSIFEGLSTQALTVSGGGTGVPTTGTLTSNITGNTFQNATGTAENNVGMLSNAGALHVSTVSGNIFDNVAEDGTIANTSVIRTQNSGGDLDVAVQTNTIQNINYATGGRHLIGHVFEPVAFVEANDSDLTFDGNIGTTNIDYALSSREGIFVDHRGPASNSATRLLNNQFTITSGSPSQQMIEFRARQVDPSDNHLSVNANTGNADVPVDYLDIDAEASATVNATVTNNNFNNSSATPGDILSVNNEAATSVLCADLSTNTVDGGTGTIELTETAGALNVEHASAAAVAASNSVPGANVIVTGTPQFGSPNCPTPP